MALAIAVIMGGIWLWVTLAANFPFATITTTFALWLLLTIGCIFRPTIQLYTCRILEHFWPSQPK